MVKPRIPAQEPMQPMASPANAPFPNAGPPIPMRPPVTAAKDTSRPFAVGKTKPKKKAQPAKTGYSRDGKNT